MKINHSLTLFILLALSLTAPVKAKDLQWQLQQLPIQTELRASGATEKILWVAGDKNTVFISKDQGNSWQDVSPKLISDHNFRDIAVLNQQTAIIMSVGSAEESKLLLTNNQGKDWQVLRVNADEKGFYDSIAFWDEQNGMLLGDPVDGHFVVELTKDQGKSWQRINTAQLPAMAKDEIAFAASGNTLITGKAGEVWFITGGLSASVYSSNDYGRHWQKSTLPLYNKTKTAGGYALALNSKQHLFALGGDYLNRGGQYNNLASHHPQKEQWQTVNNGFYGLRTAMSCINETCIATGKLSSDISFDHGKTWQVFSDVGFYTLSNNKNTLLAAGAKGKVAVLNINPIEQKLKSDK